MSHVFVSYARVCKGYVDRLADELEARGVPVWQDTEQLRFGEVWDARVNDAIRGASLVVLVVSREWCDSEPCQNEASQARYYKRPILEVSLERDVEGTAIQIANEYRRVSPISSLTATVETRAEGWLKGGHRRRDLLRGRSLREMARMLKKTRGTSPLTGNAERYVRASRRHARGVRIFAVVSVLIVFWAFSAYNQVRNTARETSLVGSRSYANSMLVYASAVGNRVNPYLTADGTLRALDDEGYAQDAALNDGYSTQLMMRSALDAITPTEHMDAEEADSRGFSFPDAARTRAAVEASDVTAELNENGAVVTLSTDGDSGTLVTARLEMPSFDLSFSPDGRYLAVLGEGGIAILDGHQGSQLLFLNGTQNPEGSTLAWSQDGSLVAVRGPQDFVFSWPVRQDTTILATTDSTFVDGASVKGGELAAFLASDGSITFVDVTSGSIEDVNESLEAAEAHHLAPGPGEKDFYVVARPADDPDATRLIHVDCAAGTAAELPLPDGLVPTCVSAVAGGSELAVGCEGALLVLDATGGVQNRVDGLNVSAVAMDADGRVFAGTQSGDLVVLEPGASEVTCPESAVTHGGTTPLAIAGGSGRVVSVGKGTACGNGSRSLTREWGTWVERDGITSSMTDSASPYARTIAASSDGSLFVCGLSDGTLVTFFPDDGFGVSARHELGSELRGIVISSDRTSVIGAAGDGTIVRVAVDLAANDQQALRDRLDERVRQGLEFGLYHNEANIS